jgi:hypothetical protein
MTRDDIIRLARDAGLTGLVEADVIGNFERFAALVAAAEREACAKVCEKAVQYNPDDADVAYAFADAIRARDMP